MKYCICRTHTHSLEYTCFGKPHPSVFNNAEIVLQQLVPQHGEDFNDIHHKNAQRFQTLYMIGDNPAVDIRGARKVYLLELEFTSTMVG
jgi:ribonucleotide monophosphatase NagD (HAD superfamily)